MKSGIRDFQAVSSVHQTAAQSTGIAGQRLNVRQALTALRDEDPAFDKVISTHRYTRGELVASPEELSNRMYMLMSGRSTWCAPTTKGAGW